MNRVLVRSIAYIVGGAFLGAAVWLVLFAQSTTAQLSIVTLLFLTATGMGVAILLLRAATTRIPYGIRINPLWSVVAMDSVCVLASTLACFFMIDGYSNGLFGLSPLLGVNPVALAIIAIMYLPSVLLLALFVTSSGSQSLRIDKAGLLIAGAFGEESVTWDEIENLHPDAQFVMVSRLGVPIPRHLRTNLEIVTRDGGILTIYQPELKTTARAILGRLKQYAQGPLQSSLSEMEAVWL